ncbi:putative leader peptide [Streptacidiphilus sp. P02-A3a]
MTRVQARQTHAFPAIEPRGGLLGSFSRRHIDLQRVAGALCTS